MIRSVATFLMFNEPHAEEAMTLYASLFGGTVDSVEKWAAGQPGREGSIKRAKLRLAGHEIVVSDSPMKHAFSFTPSMSLFVECASEAELEAAFAKLSEGGKVLMPIANYGFSTKFGWCDDRFGVSWQLNLA